MITLSQFQQMIPTNKEAAEWYDITVDFFEKYNITTPLRIAGFMAQCAHESQDFRALEENLNYSAETLLKVFPRYFGAGKEDAAAYARNPEKIANYVYMDANRSKQGALGNTQPGDGWKFRGGGIKQLTGRNNYAVFGKDLGMTADEVAAYVRTKKGALESACWFWKKNSLEKFADADDIVGMTKKINGGTIGLEDRQKRYVNAKKVVGNSVSSTPTKTQITDSVTVTQKAPAPAAPASGKYPTIQKKSTGDVVKKVQAKLGLSADGIYGLQTEIAVRSWQRTNKYTADGIMNDEQIRKLLGA
jgi:putative chitinase